MVLTADWWWWWRRVIGAGGGGAKQNGEDEQNERTEAFIVHHARHYHHTPSTTNSTGSSSSSSSNCMVLTHHQNNTDAPPRYQVEESTKKRKKWVEEHELDSSSLDAYWSQRLFSSKKRKRRSSCGNVLLLLSNDDVVTTSRRRKNTKNTLIRLTTGSRGTTAAARDVALFARRELFQYVPEQFDVVWATLPNNNNSNRSRRTAIDRYTAAVLTCIAYLKPKRWYVVMEASGSTHTPTPLLTYSPWRCDTFAQHIGVVVWTNSDTLHRSSTLSVFRQEAQNAHVRHQRRCKRNGIQLPRNGKGKLRQKTVV